MSFFQQFCITWRSEAFIVLNGVLQGGVISPIIFNEYMDDLPIDSLTLEGYECPQNIFKFVNNIYEWS